MRSAKKLTELVYRDLLHSAPWEFVPSEQRWWFLEPDLWEVCDNYGLTQPEWRLYRALYMRCFREARKVWERYEKRISKELPASSAWSETAKQQEQAVREAVGLYRIVED